MACKIGGGRVEGTENCILGSFVFRHYEGNQSLRTRFSSLLYLMSLHMMTLQVFNLT